MKCPGGSQVRKLAMSWYLCAGTGQFAGTFLPGRVQHSTLTRVPQHSDILLSASSGYRYSWTSCAHSPSHHSTYIRCCNAPCYKDYPLIHLCTLYFITIYYMKSVLRFHKGYIDELYCCTVYIDLVVIFASQKVMLLV